MHWFYAGQLLHARAHYFKSVSANKFALKRPKLTRIQIQFIPHALV